MPVVSLLLTLDTKIAPGDLAASRRLEIRKLLEDRLHAWLLDLENPSYLELEGSGYRIVATGTGC